MANEQSAFDLRRWLFQNRSYTPIPFLLLLILFAHPTLGSFVLGFVMVILGESLRIVSVGHAGLETRATKDVGAPRLVVTGPYGHVRNPLYVGNIMMYTGFGVMSNETWLIILGFAWFVFQYIMIVSREEEFLATEFGPEYAEYTKHVPSFFPRFSAWHRGGEALNASDRTFDFSMALKSERRSFQSLILVTVLMITIAFLRKSFG